MPITTTSTTSRLTTTTSYIADTGQWVDYRPVSVEYIRQSFQRAAKYLDGSGKYYLDAASGPIGLREYHELSHRYEVRICVNLSFRALVQARANLKGQQGLFICGDLTSLPLADGVCDAVLSQHTLYYIPASQQEAAVLELYRVAKPGATVGIAYNWFYYAWLMNLLLFPVQAYRVARYFAARLYGRLRPGRSVCISLFTPRVGFGVSPFGNVWSFMSSGRRISTSCSCMSTCILGVKSCYRGCCEWKTSTPSFWAGTEIIRSS